jgi:hypothetical protein
VGVACGPIEVAKWLNIFSITSYKWTRKACVWIWWRWLWLLLVKVGFEVLTFTCIKYKATSVNQLFKSKFIIYCSVGKTNFVTKKRSTSIIILVHGSSLLNNTRNDNQKIILEYFVVQYTVHSYMLSTYILYLFIQ